MGHVSEGRDERSSTQRHLRILSLYEKSDHPAWLQKTEIFQGLADEVARNWRKSLPPIYRIRRELLWTWRLFRTSKDYDIVLTGSDRVGLFFAVSQQLFRRRKVPHIFLDFLVEIEGDGIEQTVRKFLYRLAIRGTSRALVQRKCEIDLYSQVLRAPATRFSFVLYHSTIFNTPIETQEKGFIFAGGDGHRDYPLLIEAVKGLPYCVVIAALQTDHFHGLTIPPNVRIITVQAAEFIKLVAEASLVVVPLKKRPQHVGGEQTYANAMTMGKVTIVTDLDASDYIENGETGILTPAGDVAALRQAIKKVMEDHEFARALGQRAKEASTKFAPERFFETVFKLCDECTAPRPSKG